MSMEEAATKSGLDSLDERIFEKVPGAREAWEKAKAELRPVLALIRLRKNKGLSQRQVADRAGWHKSYVSRLESGQGGVPDIATFMRYVEACRASSVLVVGDSPDREHFHVVDAVSLNREGENQFAALRNHDILIPQAEE